MFTEDGVYDEEPQHVCSRERLPQVSYRPEGDQTPGDAGGTPGKGRRFLDDTKQGSVMIDRSGARSMPEFTDALRPERFMLSPRLP